MSTGGGHHMGAEFKTRVHYDRTRERHHGAVAPSRVKRYMLTCRAFAVEVETDYSDVIVWSSRQAAKFYRQPLAALIAFMKKFGTVEAVRMDTRQSVMFE